MTMAREDPFFHQRPSLGEKLSSYRKTQEKKKHKKNSHLQGGVFLEQESVEPSQRRTRSLDRPRPQRRNSFVKVNRANVTTSTYAGGMIITSTATTTTSNRCNSHEDLPLCADLKSTPSMKISMKTQSKSLKTDSNGGIMLVPTIQKKQTRYNCEEDGDRATRKLRKPPPMRRSLGERSKSFRALAGSIRNLFSDDSHRDDSNKSNASSSKPPLTAFVRKSKNKQVEYGEQEEARQIQGRPVRRKMVVRLE